MMNRFMIVLTIFVVVSSIVSVFLVPPMSLENEMMFCFALGVICLSLAGSVDLIMGLISKSAGE